MVRREFLIGQKGRCREREGEGGRKGEEDGVWAEFATCIHGGGEGGAFEAGMRCARFGDDGRLR